jgi:hypothetical protein
MKAFIKYARRSGVAAVAGRSSRTAWRALGEEIERGVMVVTEDDACEMNQAVSGEETDIRD